MDSKYLSMALILPAVLLAIWAEYRWAVSKGLAHLFKFKSSVSNLSIGIAERALNIVFSGFFFGVLHYLQQQWGWLPLGNHWWDWVLLFIAVDFAWYWYHRLGHEINLLWAFHIVHHHSEEYNLTAATRITLMQTFVRMFFWSVLALLGFPAVMLVLMYTLHGVYQFLIHTQLINKLGWFEHVLVTPSHHRVHHGSNEEYLDKNYGGVLIIWDKLFGTFCVEGTPVKYGITEPLQRWSFLWGHFHFLIRLIRYAARQESWKESLRILFGKPELLKDDDFDAMEEQLFRKRVFQPVGEIRKPKRLRVYVGIQVGLSALFTFIFTLFFEQWTNQEHWALLGFVLLTLINIGALIDQRRWVFYLELARVAILFWFLTLCWPLLWLKVLLSGLLLVVVIGFTTLSNLYASRLYGTRYMSGRPGALEWKKFWM